MIAWLKFLHIAAIAIWMAGLVSLPGLYVQRTHVADNDELYRLQRMVRFAYRALMSPAAFVAVATGTALIFLHSVFEPWLTAKLALVGLLVLWHALTGLVIIRLFNEGEIYPVWRFVAVTSATVLVMLAVIYLVLVKPPLDLQALLPAVLSEPGGLRRFFDQINPLATP